MCTSRTLPQLQRWGFFLFAVRESDELPTAPMRAARHSFEGFADR
jgi:hypothetical protein